MSTHSYENIIISRNTAVRVCHDIWQHDYVKSYLPQYDYVSSFLREYNHVKKYGRTIILRCGCIIFSRCISKAANQIASSSKYFQYIASCLFFKKACRFKRTSGNCQTAF